MGIVAANGDGRLPSLSPSVMEFLPQRLHAHPHPQQQHDHPGSQAPHSPGVVANGIARGGGGIAAGGAGVGSSQQGARNAAAVSAATGRSAEARSAAEGKEKQRAENSGSLALLFPELATLQELWQVSSFRRSRDRAC